MLQQRGTSPRQRLGFERGRESLEQRARSALGVRIAQPREIVLRQLDAAAGGASPNKRRGAKRGDDRRVHDD